MSLSARFALYRKQIRQVAYREYRHGPFLE